MSLAALCVCVCVFLAASNTLDRNEL